MTTFALMRGAAGVVALSLVALGAAGCSDGEGTPSEAVSSAASAVQSAGEAVSSAAAEAKRAAESAAAVAQDKLAEVKDGVDAKGHGTDGYTTVPVTVQNTDDGTKSFAVQVEFKDESGNLVDTAVVTITDVAGKGTGQGTARSTHKLSGTVTAQTGTALRY